MKGLETEEKKTPNTKGNTKDATKDTYTQDKKKLYQKGLSSKSPDD